MINSIRKTSSGARWLDQPVPLATVSLTMSVATTVLLMVAMTVVSLVLADLHGQGAIRAAAGALTVILAFALGISVADVLLRSGFWPRRRGNGHLAQVVDFDAARATSHDLKAH